MLENLVAFVVAVWQVHFATIGMFASGHGFAETLMVVILGSSLGVTIYYYLPEVIVFCGFFRKPSELKMNQPKPSSISSYHELFNFLKYWQTKISRQPKENLLHQIGIFIITITPFPNFELIAIAVSRLLKIPYGFQIIMFGNIIRVLLVVSGVYFGFKFCQIF